MEHYNFEELRAICLDYAQKLAQKRKYGDIDASQVIKDAESFYAYFLAIKPSAKVLKLAPNKNDSSRPVTSFDKAAEKFAELYCKLDKPGGDAVLKYMNRLLVRKKQSALL
jgi:hypothetical protein